MGAIKPRLHILRAERGVKAIQIIADATSISPATLYNFENGKTKRMDYRVLAALCEYLECEVGDLLEYVADEEKK